MSHEVDRHPPRKEVAGGNTRSLDSTPTIVGNNERGNRKTATRRIEKVLPRNARRDN